MIEFMPPARRFEMPIHEFPEVAEMDVVGYAKPLVGANTFPVIASPVYKLKSDQSADPVLMFADRINHPFRAPRWTWDAYVTLGVSSGRQPKHDPVQITPLPGIPGYVVWFLENYDIHSYSHESEVRKIKQSLSISYSFDALQKAKEGRLEEAEALAKRAMDAEYNLNAWALRAAINRAMEREDIVRELRGTIRCANGLIREDHAYFDEKLTEFSIELE